MEWGKSTDAAKTGQPDKISHPHTVARVYPALHGGLVAQRIHKTSSKVANFGGIVHRYPLHEPEGIPSSQYGPFL